MAGNVAIAHAASACNAAQFVADVTIPDGTYITAGANFVKTWRLKNVGTCTWNTSYALVFDSGTQMGTTSTVLHAQVRISRASRGFDRHPDGAHARPGTYRGYWKLRSSTGQIFGIGSAYSSAFWVEIRVLVPQQDDRDLRFCGREVLCGVDI